MSDQTQPQIDGRPDDYRGFSIGAVVAIVGALITLAAYPMVWWVAKDDSDSWIKGIGTTHASPGSSIEFHSSKLHVAAGAGAVVLIIVAIARLIGKYDHEWNRATYVAGGVALVGALYSCFVPIGADFTTSTGVYVVLVGGILAAIGAALIAVAKK
ncbi:hypothetical protein [Gordonia sp. (in: high G+C Gram-positive bacteria)]|uniref:hypothetical protein n=1 Tax=Gordonia sp. (in: high G+C Gram-positive bacteria) TaxID=84139 RepID=UPI0039E47CC7